MAVKCKMWFVGLFMKAKRRFSRSEATQRTSKTTLDVSKAIKSLIKISCSVIKVANKAIKIALFGGSRVARDGDRTR
jgi:hypothetical protein